MVGQDPRIGRRVDAEDVLQNALLRALETGRPDSARVFFGLSAEQMRRELLDLARHYYGPAGLPPGAFCCHSFRATTATNLLKQKVAREQVQYLLGHLDAWTTDLYNLTEKEVTRKIVQRISI